MKRMFSFFAAALLAAGLGLAGTLPVQAATTSSGTVVTPDGKVVRKLPALVNKKPGKDAGVYKGKPTKTTILKPAVAAGCDGSGTSACFLYNVGSQGSLNKYGLAATVRIGGDTGALDTTNDWHTLGEVAAQSSDGKQIVEIGWTVDPAVNKTSGVGVTTPRVFVFSWVNGVAGVYNGGNFVPVSGVSTVPGVTNLTPGAYAQAGIYHDDTQHVWWVEWGAEWIGYYPDTQWSGATPAATFTRAQFVQLFGEIASAKSKPCSDMGFGGLPVTGSTTGAAYFASTTYFNSGPTNDSASVNLTLSTQPSATASSPEAAVLGAGSPPSTTNLRTFYYGGPMWNAAGTAAGSKGSC